MEIVEVFWNARPHLSRLRMKVGAGTLDPVADRLFNDVREAAAETFPGKVTLVRIATRRGAPDVDLAILRNGKPECPQLHASLGTLIDDAVDQAAKRREGILS
jgi:hypothetical protein